MNKEIQNISTVNQLDNPWYVLRQAISIFRKRLFTFWGIIAIPFFVLLSISLISIILVFTIKSVPILMVTIFFIALALFLTLFLFLWSQVSLVVAIFDKKISIKESYKKSKAMILEYLILSCLVFLVVVGGFAFLIVPGIILSVYLTFSVFVFIGEEDKRLNALLKSYEYIKGYWWAIFRRIILIVSIFLIASFVVINILQTIGLSKDGAGMVNNALSMFFAPIATIYYYLIYNNLKSIKSRINIDKTRDKKTLFVGLIIFALLAIIIASGFVVLNPYHLK